jgi:hypothetical protein
MDANKAVHYQSPAHVHPQSDVAGLVADLAAKASNAGTSGGPFAVSPYNRTGGGFLARPYTADVQSAPNLLLIAGGDYTAEFTSYNVCFTDGNRGISTLCRSITYDAGLNQTVINLRYDVTSSTSGMVVDASSSGLVVGFGNTIAFASAAVGQLCLSVGRFSFAAGLAAAAFGDQAAAIGSYANAYGFCSVAVGAGTATAYGSSAFNYGMVGYSPDLVTSLVGGTVTISGDVRSHFNNSDNVLVFRSTGEYLSTYVTSVPAYGSGVTTFTIAAQPGFTAERIVDTMIGQYAFAEGGSRATASYAHAEGSSTLASGPYSHAEGRLATASGDSSHAEGNYTTASAQYAHAEGYYTTASAKGAHGSGYYSTANKQYQRALAAGRFAAAGDCQYTETVLRRATTDATPAELTIDGAAPSGTTENTSNRFILATGKTYACLVMIAARKSDGVSAFFLRQVVVKNVSGTVSLEGAVPTVGVDINPAGWTVPAITADNTNKSLMITVTGIAATNIRWCATVQAQEILY